MKKSWVLAVLLFLSFFAIISCGKNHATGIAGAGKIKLTETMTPTPDVNFAVYIHQEATPVTNVLLTIRSMETGATLTAKTGPAGLGGFEVHSGGQWNLQVDGFNGFKTQSFTVEPLSNTFYAVNYGIPSLDMELVSGSETIPIAPSTLVYKVTYHTKFERGEKITINKKNLISASIPPPNVIDKEGDSLTFTIDIPKSFEGFDINDKYLNFNSVCEASNGNTNTMSNERTLTKGWIFNVNIQLHYMQVYAYDENNRRIVYYAGIQSLDPSASSGISFKGAVQCQILNAQNIGLDGAGITVNAGTCAPWYTNFGCFQSIMRINTNAGLANGQLSDNNNGHIFVRFYDGFDGELDVVREFETTGNWPWSGICSDWCCTSAPLTGVSRTHSDCHPIGSALPYGSCGLLWDNPVTADAKREKSGSVNAWK